MFGSDSDLLTGIVKDSTIVGKQENNFNLFLGNKDMFFLSILGLTISFLTKGFLLNICCRMKILNCQRKKEQPFKDNKEKDLKINRESLQLSIKLENNNTPCVARRSIGDKFKFYGRDNEYNTINDELDNGMTIVITGASGVGKSTIAKRYIVNAGNRETKTKYKRIIHLSSGFQGGLMEAFRIDKGSFSDSLNDCYKKIACPESLILLVFDNAKSYYDAAEFFPDKTIRACFRIIVTTSHLSVSNQKKYRCIRNIYIYKGIEFSEAMRCFDDEISRRGKGSFSAPSNTVKTKIVEKYHGSLFFIKAAPELVDNWRKLEKGYDRDQTIDRVINEGFENAINFLLDKVSQFKGGEKSLFFLLYFISSQSQVGTNEEFLLEFMQCVSIESMDREESIEVAKIVSGSCNLLNHGEDDKFYIHPMDQTTLKKMVISRSGISEDILMEKVAEFYVRHAYRKEYNLFDKLNPSIKGRYINLIATLGEIIHKLFTLSQNKDLIGNATFILLDYYLGVPCDSEKAYQYAELLRNLNDACSWGDCPSLMLKIATSRMRVCSQFGLHKILEKIKIRNNTLCGLKEYGFIDDGKCPIGGNKTEETFRHCLARFYHSASLSFGYMGGFKEMLCYLKISQKLYKELGIEENASPRLMGEVNIIYAKIGLDKFEEADSARKKMIERTKDLTTATAIKSWLYYLSSIILMRKNNVKESLIEGDLNKSIELAKRHFDSRRYDNVYGNYIIPSLKWHKVPYKKHSSTFYKKILESSEKFLGENHYAISEYQYYLAVSYRNCCYFNRAKIMCEKAKKNIIAYDAKNIHPGFEEKLIQLDDFNRSNEMMRFICYLIAGGTFFSIIVLIFSQNNDTLIKGFSFLPGWLSDESSSCWGRSSRVGNEEGPLSLGCLP